MGNNDFSVAHAGVRKLQKAGTLERVVKYDKDAFERAWEFLASSSCDGRVEAKMSTTPRPWTGGPSVPRRTTYIKRSGNSADRLCSALSAARVEEVQETPSSLPLPPAVSVETMHNVVAEAEFDDAATVVRAEEPAGVNVPATAHRDYLVLRKLFVLAAVAGLTAAVFDFDHGLATFHEFQHWASGAPPHAPTHVTGDGSQGIHFAPLRSLATGAGAGFTRAVSRTLTFPLDTLKTRSQVSKLGAQDRAALPEDMRRLIDGPASFDGVFKGFTAFLVQAGPANAIFFLFYDALNAVGTSMLPTAGGGGLVDVLPALLHLSASSLATVPTNLVRTPAEVVKQRLQVGQESGSSLAALFSIAKSDGIRGLFVGGKEQLMREIPFNAIQFTMYEFLKSHFGSSELLADASLGATSSAFAALVTQPVDTVKTRVMTKSVPGISGGVPPGFVKSAKLISEAEGASSLFLGLLPRLFLVSTGGAFYFWGQEFVAQLMSSAGY